MAILMKLVAVMMIMMMIMFTMFDDDVYLDDDIDDGDKGLR